MTINNKSVKRTTYVLKNNSTERVVDKFYIDHVADPGHKGYVVTTKENSIKAVMGFSRFSFSLKPQQEITFVVEEEAFFTTSQLGTRDL